MKKNILIISNDKLNIQGDKISADYNDVINIIESLSEKNTLVPYKICSFDIEASSSHGDFPVPIKSYKKLANNIMEFYDHSDDEVSKTQIIKIIKTAFGFDDMFNVDKVYPKNKPTIKKLNALLEILFSKNIENLCKKSSQESSIERMFQRCIPELGDEEENETNNKKSKIDMKTTIIDLINNTLVKREEKVDKLTDAFTGSGFPSLEGDKVTFIGSTFLNYGEQKPYLNNCLALNTCADVPEIDNSEIKNLEVIELETRN